MKLLSLFDGSGGFPLAASLCGIEPKYASEVEPYPIAVTRSRFPNMIHLGDISKVSGYDLEPCSVITFGSPCQDISIAGKRQGIKHEAARIVTEMREATNGRYPEFIVWENVPGAFSSNKGEDFRIVLQTLIEIVEPGAVMPPVPKMGWAYADYYCGDGWSLAYRTVDAQYWGVPQRRRRIYLVLDLRGHRAGKVLFEREGVRGYFTPCRSPGEEAAADAERSIGVYDCAESVYNIGDRREVASETVGVCCTLTCKMGTGGNNVPVVLRPVIPDDQRGQQITLREEVVSCLPFDTTQVTSPQNGNNPKWGDPCHPLSATAHAPSIVCKCFDARGNGDGKTCSTITGDHENRITDYTTVVCIQGNCIDRNAQQNGFGVNEDKSFTLNAVDRHGVAYCMAHGQANAEICENVSLCLNCNHEQPIVFDKEVYNSGVNATGAHYIVSRLTPTECCRLQGFPDGWGEIDPLDVSDSREAKLWLDVYKTYCAMIGRNLNPSIVGNLDSLKKWHDKLHTDSAEYKMWGNGIALPNALYVMQGIVENI